jgi:hypothetical protein
MVPSIEPGSTLVKEKVVGAVFYRQPGNSASVLSSTSGAPFTINLSSTDAATDNSNSTGTTCHTRRNCGSKQARK